jgi:predicted RNA-binding protein associated with RNAse of E/G family
MGMENQWYADLIDIKYINSSEIEIKDLFIDIIIEGNGPTYRMIDFEDVIEALKSKKIEIEELESPFKKLQQFLDNHLHKGKDFPPSVIRPFTSK